ncbi:SRPBCC domain-containing protein [Salinimonas sp. HHU 13199]|uniref:SRPBCC domain-containing protein n=1 Tax=Salinimonas profundi TaxID=2729140 RepID=A0ABR8LKP6_9ALTE|nr:SRPBCC domain-containing protein [Salinimonas profundi]MBD3584644.1 SRPBCC domain-containing protein [Salinimonas profundi]
MKRAHFLSGFLVLNAAVAPEAFAEVTEVSEHGFVIRNSFVTRQPADTVWLSLINDVDNWWPKDHSWWEGTFSINATAGGCFCERKNNKSAEHMRVSYVDPPVSLVMTGGLGPLQSMGVYGALNWQITPDDGQTRVTLTYQAQGYLPSGFKQLAPVVDQVQAGQLARLHAWLRQTYPD